MTITDAISAIILLGFALNGWLKGFLRVILGPISLVLATVVSYVYYQSTQNIPIALAIGAIGPFLLKFCLQFAVNTWNSAIDRNLPPSLVSRAVGACLGIAWGACLVGLMVLMIAVIPLPPGTGTLQKSQQNVKDSYVFSRLPSFGKDLALANEQPAKGGQPTNGTFPVLNQEMAQRFRSSEEFKTLMDDPKVQEIFKDEATIKQIENKDFGKLLTNKKFLKLLADPKLLEKMMHLHSTIANPPQQIQP